MLCFSLQVTPEEHEACEEGPEEKERLLSKDHDEEGAQ
jgi:hypothetical protein